MWQFHCYGFHLLTECLFQGKAIPKKVETQPGATGSDSKEVTLLHDPPSNTVLPHTGTVIMDT